MSRFRSCRSLEVLDGQLTPLLIFLFCYDIKASTLESVGSRVPENGGVG
jgi:hypothetical protein